MIDRPTTLYRLFDSAGQLLYVGITSVGAARWGQHSATQPWWGDVASATTEHFASRGEAARAEAVAIRDEHPMHNVLLRRGPRPAPILRPCRPPADLASVGLPPVAVGSLPGDAKLADPGPASGAPTYVRHRRWPDGIEVMVPVADFCTPKQAAALLGVSRSMVSVYQRGDFPAPLYDRGRLVLWSREDVEAWRASRPRHRRPA